MSQDQTPNPDQTDRIQKILSRLDPEERQAAIHVLEQRASGNTALLDRLRGAVYEFNPPPIDDFVFSSNYLGLPRHAVFPEILNLLHQADDPGIREVFVIAGKGSGKSTITSVLMARALYQLLAYRDPSAYFGVLPGTDIAVLNMSISSTQAEFVIFSKLLTLLEKSNCFYGPDNAPFFLKRKRHIEFIKKIHALSGHSGYQAYFGYDVYCAALDECAWYKDTQDHPVSEEIYQGVRSSAKTRFPHEYKLIGISTPQADDDFICSKLNDAKRSGERILVAEGDDDKMNVEVT